MLGAVYDFHQECDVNGLRKDLFALLDPMLIVSRYRTNNVTINAELSNIEKCYSNATACELEPLGESWGTIIRLMTTWGL